MQRLLEDAALDDLGVSPDQVGQDGLPPGGQGRRRSRSIAVRLAIASMQPRRPHPQRGPSTCIIMWPISPAVPPEPVIRRPWWMIPPPMPVPMNIPTAVRAWRAAPSHFSPSVPRFTSLPSTAAARELLLERPDQVHARDVQVRREDHFLLVRADNARHGQADRGDLPGRNVAGVQQVSDRLDHRADNFLGAALAGVGARSLASTAPRGVVKAARIFVPPTSTPTYNRSL